MPRYPPDAMRHARGMSLDVTHTRMVGASIKSRRGGNDDAVVPSRWRDSPLTALDA